MTDEQLYEQAKRLSDGLMNHRWPGYERLAVEAAIMIQMLVTEHKRMAAALEAKDE
ncbi:MAG: hypothetical protein RIQ99_476 [Pseudomonadota bacterium]|jgi:hypothetical protein